MSDQISEPPKSRARPCPICGKPPVERYTPFCSARCAQVDLGRWFTGRYVIESDQTPEDEIERLRDED
jgi:endogenous inhibitor of DNA gyrase (YacG/DUF329 family)